MSAIHRDRCREFSGRLDAGPGNKAELYQHMKEDVSTASSSLVQCQSSMLPLLSNCTSWQKTYFDRDCKQLAKTSLNVQMSDTTSLISITVNKKF